MKEKIFSLMGFSLQRDSLKTEILSGLTTFITMVYILALMPVVFAPLGSKGFPVESVFTVTALGAIVGTLFMAFIAKRPFGQAPGLTLNAFFVSTVCLSLGYPWQFALTAVFVEGLLFIGICMSNMRQVIFEMLPATLKYGIAAGIGFFIATIGFKNSGLLADGTIFNHMETLTTPSSLLFLLGIVLTGLFTIMRIQGRTVAQHCHCHPRGHSAWCYGYSRTVLHLALITGTALLPVLLGLPAVARFLGLRAHDAVL
ncbi:MAG: NCS2 family permease [Prevotella sp.]|nr:NCS2 family permease [Prevotella sp.]